MPAYHYVAVNASGRETSGVLEADSDKLARQWLRDRSLIPINVSLTADKKRIFNKKQRLKTQQIALFTRQFATLLTAGMTVEESLAAVAEQTEKAEVKGLILSVRGKVMEGHSLAAALSEHPDAFAALFCATIAAGEKSGHLDKVLLRLADYTEQQAAMQQKLKTALIYPVMIVLVAFGIVGFLLAYVVPKMIAVYANLNQALPLLTILLIAMSHFVNHYGCYVVIVLAAAVAWVRYLIKKNIELREKWHWFLLRLPMVGYAIRSMNTARFSRTLSILSASGVPVLEAMSISAKLITAIPIQKAVAEAVARVREGAAVHLALKQTTYFTPMSVHMIASGEGSGELDNMLARVAEHQENDMVRLIDVSLALFEPAVIVMMGLIVLFIVLAVLLPIFELNQFTL